MIEDIFNALIEKVGVIKPDMVNLLHPGSNLAKIEEIESHIGMTLPEELKSLYLLHDGQKTGQGFFFDWPFLSADEMLNEWTTWNEIHKGEDFEDVNSVSFPIGYIKEVYCSKSWIPFSTDYSGNNFAIDLDPGPKGQIGQVIVFGRDFDKKFVLSKNLTDFIEYYLNSLKDGKYTQEDEGYILIDMPRLAVNERNDSKDDGLSFEDWKLQLADEWQQALAPYFVKCKTFDDIGSISSLNLLRTNILDLSPLIMFKGLRELIASGTKLQSLSGLENCSELKKAFFGKITPKDISAIKYCAQLQSLSFSNTPLQNLDPILSLHNLKALSIDGTGIKNLSGIEILKSLSELDISNNEIIETSQLIKLKKLKELNISRTNISNLDFLENLKSLEIIEIHSLIVSDYSVLSNLKKLKRISCSFDQFEKIIKVLNFKTRFTMVGEITDEQKNIWSNYMRDS